MVRIEGRILSPTAINTYMSCPRKFYLRYIKKLAGKPSIHLIRGSIVHKTLQEFHRKFTDRAAGTGLSNIRKDLLSTFNVQWKSSQASLEALGIGKEQLDLFHTDSELMLINFSQWFYDHGMPVPNHIELKVFSPTHRLFGVIDAVFDNYYSVILIDYKTSKKAEITDDILRQAALYAVMFEDKYQKIPDTIWIHFLKNAKGPTPIEVDENLMEYGKILNESVRKKTRTEDEKDYPCTCGGYCGRDFG